MRIAVAGTHYSGKTSLVEALAAKLKNHALFEEPYLEMASEGYEFADVPSVDDFFEQLKRNVAMISASESNSIFDRSPLDFFAYALCLTSRDELDLDPWRELTSEGLDGLDAVVFCAVEEADRITLPRGEDRKLRLRVDEKLRELIEAESELEVIEVSGSLEQRVAQVLRQCPSIL